MAARGKKIFISYRREDAADTAGRIRDWLILTRRIARDDIFMDVTAILPGADFMQVITDTLRQCHAVIVVISPSWLKQISAADTSYVRAEAEIALDLGIPVIPVLVGGAKLPSADQLPERLRGLTRLNIQPLRHDTFDYDMGLVERALHLGPGIGMRRSMIAAGAALLVVALSLGVLTQTPASAANPLYRVFHSAAASPTGHTTTPTATATVAGGAGSPQDLYTRVTSTPPTLTDPMGAQDANNWDDGASATGVCSFRAFAYHVAVTSNDTTVECFENANGYSNFAFQTTMSLISGDAGGVIFRVSQKTGPRYRWAIYADGHYDVVLGTGQFANTVLARGTSPAIKSGTGQSNVLTVIAQGNAINLYANGQFVTTVVAPSTSNAPLAGALGMFAYDSSQDTDVAFTDVKVWTL